MNEVKTELGLPWVRLPGRVSSPWQDFALPVLSSGVCTTSCTLLQVCTSCVVGLWVCTLHHRRGTSTRHAAGKGLHLMRFHWAGVACFVVHCRLRLDVSAVVRRGAHVWGVPGSESRNQNYRQGRSWLCRSWAVSGAGGTMNGFGCRCCVSRIGEPQGVGYNFELSHRYMVFRRPVYCSSDGVESTFQLNPSPLQHTLGQLWACIAGGIWRAGLS